ncbi:MAG: PBP1A family penicillin-binding protein [Gemmatimonadota bacterium]
MSAAGKPGVPRRVVGWLRGHGGLLAGILLAFLALGACAGGMFIGTWRNICAECPSIAQLSVWEPLRASRVLDRNGLLISEFFRERRTPIRIENLPDHVPQAFVAVEDKRFYEHEGLDYRRLVSANVQNVISMRITGGGSTITQQLARWMFSDEIGFDQVLTRKLKEMHVARQLEAVYSKEQILEAYINQVNYGHGKYGIETAAVYYFGRTAPELNPAEAALLAAVINAPSHYSPFRHPDRALSRRNTVLALMGRQGYLSAEEVARWREHPLPEGAHAAESQGDLAPYFVEWVRDDLDDRYGETLYSGGLTIHTTLDLQVQRRAAAALDSGFARIENAPGYRHPTYASVAEEAAGAQLTRIPYVQGMLLAMDPDSGDVLALIGGRDFSHSRFNRVTQALRQPGSLFKPFVYATAINQGIPASHVMHDAPVMIELPEGGEYAPRNYDPEFRGPLTLRDAMKFSVNTIAVQLGQEVGMENVARTARQMGLRTEIPPYPSTAIGAADILPLDLATAYTAFANAGVAVRPRAVIRVEDAEGRVLWQTRPEREVVLDSLTAAIVRDMLRSVVASGTANNAVRNEGGLPYSVPAAGKTGTTNDYTDVWFMGFTPNLLATVWFGFDQPRRIINRASGGRFAAPVWGQFATSLYAGDEPVLPTPEEWSMPRGLSTRVIDRATGTLASDWCDPEQSYLEYFIPGTEPTEVCSPYDRGLFRGRVRRTDPDTSDLRGRFRLRLPPDTTAPPDTTSVVQR